MNLEDWARNLQYNKVSSFDFWMNKRVAAHVALKDKYPKSSLEYLYNKIEDVLSERDLEDIGVNELKARTLLYTIRMPKTKRLRSNFNLSINNFLEIKLFELLKTEISLSDEDMEKLEIEDERLLLVPLEEMPLYMSKKGIPGMIANWRLEIGI